MPIPITLESSLLCEGDNSDKVDGSVDYICRFASYTGGVQCFCSNSCHSERARAQCLRDCNCERPRLVPAIQNAFLLLEQIDWAFLTLKPFQLEWRTNAAGRATASVPCAYVAVNVATVSRVDLP